MRAGSQGKDAFLRSGRPILGLSGTLSLLFRGRVSFLRAVGRSYSIRLYSSAGPPLILLLALVENGVPCLWTKRIAMEEGKERAAALTETILSTRSRPPRTPAARDCIPPIELPTVANNLSIPRKSSNLN